MFPILIPSTLRTCASQPVAHSRQPRFGTGLSLLLFAVLAMLMQPAAHAQTSSGSVTLASPTITAVAGGGGAGAPTTTQQTATSVQLNNPQKLAVDSSGNVYIADQYNGTVEELTPTGEISVIAGGGSTVPSATAEAATVASITPAAVTLDSNGNLYIADYNQGDVYEVTGLPGGGSPQIVAIAGSIAGGSCNNPTPEPTVASQICISPGGLTFDAAGNLYISDYNEETIDKITGLTSGSPQIAVIAGYYEQNSAKPWSQSANYVSIYPQDLVFDTVGNLYITDYYDCGAVDKITGLSGNNPQITVVAGYECDNSPTLQPMSANQAYMYPVSLAFDNVGNLYTADRDNEYIDEITGLSSGNPQIIAIAGYNGAAPPSTISELADAATMYPGGLAVDSTGNLYVSDDQNNLVAKIPLVLSTFPATAVGATSTTQNVSVQLSAASTISSISIPKTQNGAQEFTVGAVTGCTTDGATSNPANTVCVVPVTFTPQYPGMRTGALTLYSSGTTILGTVGLNGIGNGPLSTFQPSTQSTVPVSGLGSPYVAVTDTMGNLYIADSGNGQVEEIQANGTQTTLPITGLQQPGSLAVDAAGNLYIADFGTDQVVEWSPSGVQSTISRFPLGLFPLGPIAVDSADNLYVTIADAGLVVELLPSGGFNVLISRLSNPGYLAIDPLGNLYVADCGNNDVVEYAPSTGEQTTVPATGLSCPMGLAVDAAGDLYIGDSQNSRVVEVTPAGVQTALPLTGQVAPQPYGVTVDAAGNLYVADNSNIAILKLTPPVAPALTFAAENTGDSSAQQTVILSNIGNQALDITALNSTTTGQTSSSFNLNGSATTCNTSTPLAVGTTCGLGVDFFPLAGGPLTGTVNITDNNLNAAGTIQQVSLSGTGIAPPPITPSYTMTANPTSLTIAAGQTGTTTLTFTPVGGYTGSVTLSCGSLPASASCTFTQGGTANSTVTMDGTNTAITVTLAISTNVATAMNVLPTILQTPGARPAVLLAALKTPTPMNPILPALAFWGPGGLAGLAAFGRKKKLSKSQRSFLQLGLLVLLTGALAAGISGCGGSSSTPASKSVTPAGASTVVITAAPTSGSSQTLNLSVTITG